MLHPPLRLTNALPYDLELEVGDGQQAPESLRVPLGASVDLFRFDLARKVRVGIPAAPCPVLVMA